MTAAVIAAIRRRAAEPIRVDHNRKYLADALAAARADVKVLADELEKLRLRHEREYQ